MVWPVTAALQCICNFYIWKVTAFGINIRNTEGQYEGHNTPLAHHTDQDPKGHRQYDGQGVYCGLSNAFEVFLIFTTQPYQYLSVLFLFTPVSDEPEVFLPKYSQTAILHAAHFRRVV